MTILEDGLPGMPAFIGFGACGNGASPLSSTINLESAMGYVSGFCFTIPFAIEINSLIAFYNAYPMFSEPTPPITIRAQLYEAKEASNIFSAIEETMIILSPTINEATPIGALLSGEVKTNRRVEKNSRLILVFSATSSKLEKIERVMGYASVSLVYT